MKTIIKKLFILLCPVLCLIILITCTKLEKTMWVSTIAVDKILANSAEASGKIIDLGKGATQYGHCYAKTSDVTVADLKTQLGMPSGTIGFTSHLINLEAGTKYYIRAYISNLNETIYGKETSFSTISSLVPTLTTTAISFITKTTALSGGNISSPGADTITARGMCWSTSANATLSNSKTSDGSGTGIFVSNLTGLTASTTYYNRAYATNNAGTAYGNEQSFTTSAILPTPPTVATSAATLVTNMTAVINGAFNAYGISTTITFEYGLTILYGATVIAILSPISGLDITSVNAVLTGLTPGTIYHFRVKAVNILGTITSGDQSFITLQLPSATTEAATLLAFAAATLNGTVNATDLPTTVIFEYGPTLSYGLTALASPNPVTGGNATSISAIVSGLTLGTIYHVRVKAVSTGGTTYGEDITFSTFQPPIATINAATSITNVSATLNGSVNANNSSTTVTFEYGSTALYDSTSTAVQSPVNGTTLTSVSVSIAGLSPLQTYHYRVKAISAGGTAYGADITFITTKH